MQKGEVKMWDKSILGFEVYFLFYNFILYCFFGWIYESCFVSFRQKHWVNRGFLNGPLLPIYGTGATLVYVFLEPFQYNPVLIFVLGMVIATILEYVTSYVMEKLFHAKWWDYSHDKYNFQGRICVVASLMWGFMSILMMYVLQPAMNRLIGLIPRKEGEIGGFFIAAVFMADLAITVISTWKLDKTITALAEIRGELTDYMENTRLYEIGEDAREWLDNQSFSGTLEKFREYLDSIRLESAVSVNKEEVEEKVKGFAAKYQKFSVLKNHSQKRLVNAFPTMKSTRRKAAGIIEDLRKKRK